MIAVFTDVLSTEEDFVKTAGVDDAVVFGVWRLKSKEALKAMLTFTWSSDFNTINSLSRFLSRIASAS